jgi:uncharacterized protein
MEPKSRQIEATVERILRTALRVAVVGASRDPSSDAGRIPLELQERGFVIIPITPATGELFGVPAYPSLEALPADERDAGIDVVDVFRPADGAPGIAHQAVAIGAKALWLQLGIVSDEAKRIARDGGLDFVQNRCMGRESRRLSITKPNPERKPQASP